MYVGAMPWIALNANEFPALTECSSYINSVILREAQQARLAAVFKGAVSRKSAKLGNYKIPVKLRETLK